MYNNKNSLPFSVTSFFVNSFHNIFTDRKNRMVNNHMCLNHAADYRVLARSLFVRWRNTWFEHSQLQETYWQHWLNLWVYAFIFIAITCKTYYKLKLEKYCFLNIHNKNFKLMLPISLMQLTTFESRSSTTRKQRSG